MNIWSADVSVAQVYWVSLSNINQYFLKLHPGARYNCAGRFNDLTCECECDEQTFGNMEQVQQ